MLPLDVVLYSPETGDFRRAKFDAEPWLDTLDGEDMIRMICGVGGEETAMKLAKAIHRAEGGGETVIKAHLSGQNALSFFKRIGSHKVARDAVDALLNNPQSPSEHAG